jgi:gallate dioxygenase
VWLDAEREAWAGVQSILKSALYCEKFLKAFRINDHLHRMVEPAHREAFSRDLDASVSAAEVRSKQGKTSSDPPPRLAGVAGLWRDPLHVGETGRSSRRVSDPHIYAVIAVKRWKRSSYAERPGALYSVESKNAGDGSG